VFFPGGETCCHEAVFEAITNTCPGAAEWAEGCMKAGVGQPQRYHQGWHGWEILYLGKL